jgi:hypothetical protein
MNKQIKELLIQAGIELHYNVVDGTVAYGEQFEKFAELIMSPERAKQLAEWDAVNRKRMADLTDTYIKKLAVTSGAYDCLTDPWDAAKNGDEYSSVMPDLVRFAELIIKECTKQVFYREENEEDDNISESIVNRINEHFGVQE